MQPEALNCPNCGGAVASDKIRCQFCGSRLKTVGCPACFGLMFLGSKHCSHCGVKAVQAEVIDETKAGECPRCKIKLNLLQIDETTLRECRKCDGVWAGVETFENICADREKQSAVLGFIAKKEPQTPLAKITYVPCPDCGQLMNRSNFASSSGVIIDLCKQHGVWLDADELPKIIEFINSGGMARAREKEKISIEEQRSHLRDEQRRQAVQDQRYGIKSSWDVETDSPVKSIVSFLFD